MSKYKDAATKLEPFVIGSAQKIYPRVSVDLKKFEGTPEIDEKVDIRGRICGIHKHEEGGTVDLEVTDICVPEKKEKLDDPKNEADRDLKKMRGY